jgi:hypothetical protein
MTEICVKCKLAYKPKKNGVCVDEQASFGSYKLWEADLKECPGCGNQIVAGFAQEPFSEHFQEGHQYIIENAKSGDFYYEWREK